ncbi:MAG TPA: hypothetical protein VN048_00355 [Verrucomicrobiae bacterium]|jgi:hypothetical protein|nr:hypothetical protein [Verrucomicrobiae bacterium]
MKPSFNIYDPRRCQNRWVCYFDILGFKERLKRDGIVAAVHWYFQSREIVESLIHKKTRLRLQCFSDTFLIYSSDDSAASFLQIEQAARWIVNLNLAKRIPLRGAVACGEVYIAEEDDIYIGNPLNEAYGHGENLNWIGFLLCRSATQRLTDLGLPPSRRLNYRRFKIPWTKKISGQKPLYAYLIGASSPRNGQNDYLEILREMMPQAGNAKKKYQKIIDFLEQHGVLKIVEPTADKLVAKARSVRV